VTSPANRALLERKFGRSLPAGDPKVTLTVSGICKLLDEARAEGAADVADMMSRRHSDPATEAAASIMEIIAGARSGRNP
jgi:hypothetical protein